MSICLSEKLYSLLSILSKDADCFGFDCTKGFTWFRLMLHIKDNLFVKAQEEWYPIHIIKKEKKVQQKLTDHPLTPICFSSVVRSGLSLKLNGWYSLRPLCRIRLHSLGWPKPPFSLAGSLLPCLTGELYGCCSRKKGPCSALVKNTSPLHHLIILLNENKRPNFASHYSLLDRISVSPCTYCYGDFGLVVLTGEGSILCF